jgi:lactate dehydrogenase-like 2-hydroxyacid dehydrogenase
MEKNMMNPSDSSFGSRRWLLSTFLSLSLGRIRDLTFFYSAHDAWNAVAEVAELTVSHATNRTQFLAELRQGVHDGVVAICDRAPPSMAQTGGKWDDELLDAMPKSLKFVAHMGAGYDSIDIAACTARGILVSNCPKVVDEATADCAMFLILAALRGFNNGIMAIRNGTWKGAVPPPRLGHEPQGKTPGILGLGGIGLTLRDKAEKAFGMKVIYHNRNRLPDPEGKLPEYVGFDDLLAKSDVLSLNLPLAAPWPLTPLVAILLFVLLYRVCRWTKFALVSYQCQSSTRTRMA